VDKQLIFSEIESLMFDLDTLVKSLANSREYISEKEFSRANTKLSEIEIQVENNQQIDDLIKEVQNQINLVGFRNTAIKYSISLTAVDGGDLGWINSKSLSNRILRILDKMELGDVSEPIIQTNTATILKILDKRTTSLTDINLDKIRTQIIKNKKNELLNLYSNNYLSKIKNNALIELK